MVKVFLTREEHYIPSYEEYKPEDEAYFAEVGRPVIEVPEELLERYNAAITAMYEVAGELESYRPAEA